MNHKKYLDFSLNKYKSYQLSKIETFLKDIKNNSKLYRKKLANVDKIKSFNDFGMLPLLNQDELRNNSLDFMRATDWNSIITVSSSSGTTGKSKLVLWTGNGLKKENEWIAFTFSLLGINRSSRMALIMPLELSRVPSYLEACKKIGAFSIPFGKITNDVELDNYIEKIKLLGTTHIYCSTSRLLSITTRAKELGYSLKSDFKVKYLLGAALHVSEKTREYLQKEWNAEFYDTYGSNETSFIGAECSEHNGLHIPP